jgi:hypothetical protein
LVSQISTRGVAGESNAVRPAGRVTRRVVEAAVPAANSVYHRRHACRYSGRLGTTVGDRRYNPFVIPSEAEESLTALMASDSNGRLTNRLPLAWEWATSPVRSPS